ncbi:MAG TPA: regulatory iron-sulfur-containing complex subunit RicT [Chitinophagaceae bacterium]|nr:regulatory iron-sulfur-containing complex subunit RicT [Chitinophagaceae bacterium]
MGCDSCGTGKPNGCKSNGGCSTGGCNRMNVHDWLMNMPIAFAADECKVIEVSFNHGSRKEFYRNATLQQLEKGDLICVEGVSGFDLGEVSMTGEIVRLQMKKKGVDEANPEMKKVLRRASDRDIDTWRHTKNREKDALIRSRAIARQLKLEMKVSEVEIQADSRKATFFYIADGRVDFRELIKIYASEFKLKVEMRQIGARQESAKVGGIGSCGRELCCSTWLTEFKSVNTTAARYQNLSINQTKLSGQCGRLKCCLNYELDTYLDALQHFPDNCDSIQVVKGNASLIKKDIFKNLMWYVLPDSNKQYPVTIERVRKIKSLNAQGVIPEELEVAEITSSKIKEVEPEFVELVGQISLRSLEKADKKRKQKQQQKQRPQHPPQQQRGQQQNPNRQQGNQQRGPNRPPQPPNRPPQPPRKGK